LNSSTTSQKTLPDTLKNLGGTRLRPNARYYLKLIGSNGDFLSDAKAINELKRTAIDVSSSKLLDLDAHEIAAQLTIRDYCVFKSIESTEYIDSLFNPKDTSLFRNFSNFEKLNNEEYFWVLNEILYSDVETSNRAKIIEHFIDIAHYCFKCKNYSSMFAILEGLDNTSIRRLTQTWKLVGAKKNKIFKELIKYNDPELNMNNYRKLLLREKSSSLVVKIFLNLVNKKTKLIKFIIDVYLDSNISIVP
jgi:hypothetical protein